jgi:hypothetical protein
MCSVAGFKTALFIVVNVIGSKAGLSITAIIESALQASFDNVIGSKAELSIAGI